MARPRCTSTCEGAVLAGNLYLPKGSGPYPGVVWVHAAGDPRPVYDGSLVAAFLRSEIAVLSYDKRGVGRSEGKCCPGDYGHFNLLTADVVGAVHALRTRRDIDPQQIGLIGASQAGWIAPRAAVESHVAFMALASAGVLRYSVVNRYEQFAGGSESDKPRPSEDEIAKKIRTIKPSGFDPQPYLERLDVPALWLYGDADRNVPPRQSVALLQSLKEKGKDCRVAGGDLTLRLPQIRA